jgi:tetratricopeptide (TPR) repeat protein
MMQNTTRLLFAAMAALLLLGTGPGVQAAPAAFDAELLAIQTDWATANYSVPENQREAAFDKLLARAATFSKQYPQRAEALIWEGIVLSTAAGVKGGLGALGLARQSRAKLDAALLIDANALDGSAYTSLGTLYHKVPGFPVGFGSDKKAREYLLKALQINPDGIDPNYFYAEFLHDEDDHAGALKHLEKALKAAPRPGRASADEGRRQDIQKLMARVRKELTS